MKLNEAEMRMAFQVESTDRIAVLNELRMMGRYAPNQEIKDTAESLLAKQHHYTENLNCYTFTSASATTTIWVAITLRNWMPCRCRST